MVSCLFLGHNLDVHGPSWIIAPFNCFVKIPLMGFTIISNNFCSLLVCKIFDALLSNKVELHPYPFIILVNQWEGVWAKAMHMTIALWNASVTHGDGYDAGLPVSCQKSQLFCGGILVRGSLYSMVQVGKSMGSLKKRGGIVSNEIPVSFIGVEFYCETSNILSICLSHLHIEKRTNTSVCFPISEKDLPWCT